MSTQTAQCLPCYMHSRSSAKLAAYVVDHAHSNGQMPTLLHAFTLIHETCRLSTSSCPFKRPHVYLATFVHAHPRNLPRTYVIMPTRTAAWLPCYMRSRTFMTCVHAHSPSMPSTSVIMPHSAAASVSYSELINGTVRVDEWQCAHSSTRTVPLFFL